MIDLDSLAEARAKALNQSEEIWRRALWSAKFQKISAQMTDGEIEGLLLSCPSVAHVDWVLGYLENHAEKTSTSPYGLLVRAAQGAGVGMGEWILGMVSGAST
jgi:hypothetical protein